MIKNGTKNNMKECDKRNIDTSSKLHMICISTNNDRHTVTKTLSSNIYRGVASKNTVTITKGSEPSHR